MTHKKHKIIEAVELSTSEPTEVELTTLYTWVVWQFPRKSMGGLSGAVHPPIPQHGWLPAVIHPRKEIVIIHAHLPKNFATPEEAADVLNHK